MKRVPSYTFIIAILLFFAAIFYPSALVCVFADGPALSADVEQLDFANGLFQRGLYKMAKDEYDKFIEAFPKSRYLSEAYFGRAESLFFLKKYKDCIDLYKQYEKQFPSASKVDLVRLRLAQSFLFLKDYSSALGWLASVNSSALDNNFKQAFNFCLGKAYRGEGKNEDALKYFNKAADILKASKYAINAFLEAGDILSEEHNLDAALKYYDRAFNSTSDKTIKSLALYKRGEAYFAAGDYLSAIQVFRDVMDKYSKEDISRDAFANLLLALYNLSRNEELVSEYVKYKDIIKKEAAFFNVYYITAAAYTALSQYKDAVAVLDEALSIPSLSRQDRDKAILKKAEILVKSNQMSSAIKLLNTSLSDAGQEQDRIFLLKAEAYYGLADFGRSYGFYKRIIDEFPGSELADEALYGAAHAKKAAGDNKNAMELFYRYFQEGKNLSKRREALYNDILIAISEGMTEKAVADSELYLEKFKNWYRSELVMFRLATLYADIKQYNKAIELLKNFISRYPKSSKLIRAYFLLAYDLQVEGKAAEALDYYKKIDISNASKDLRASVLKNMALIYLDMNEDENAAEMYEKLITEFNGRGLGIKVYIWLAEKYIDDGKMDDALRVLKCAQLKDIDERWRLEIAYFRGLALRQKGDYEDAIKNYDIVLGLKRSSVYVGASYIGKGICLSAIKEYAKARKAFESAIVECPDDATITMRARFEIANLEQEKGDLDEAYKFYMLVAVLYNDEVYCPEALFRAGRIFEELHKKEDAVKVYKEIVDVYSQSDLAVKARQRLKILGAG